MAWLVKILLPIIILIGSVFAARAIVDNRPEPRTRPRFNAALAVDAITLKSSSYQVLLKSQGVVEPAHKRILVPEVTGIVKTVSDNLVEGGFFKQGDVLVELDDRDYRIALAQAEASFAQANAALQEESARAKQALADWKSLGRKGQPSALSAREPQLAAARANLAAARAQVQQARLDVERTIILAPFDGGVLSADVDPGRFVNKGAALGSIYSVAAVDVRLPLSDREIAYLPSSAGNSSTSLNLPVTVSADVGGMRHHWRGQIIRTAGIESASQQLQVVARVPEPFAQQAGSAPLRVGLFVDAEIEAQQLQDVYVIPSSALRGNDEVLLVENGNILRAQEVELAWRDAEQAAIKSGLSEGDVLTLTILSTVADGTRVQATIDGKPPAREERAAGSRQGKAGSDGGNKPGQPVEASRERPARGS